MGRGHLACCGISQLLLFLGTGLIIAGLLVVLKVVPDHVKSTINDQKVLIQYPNLTMNDFTKSWKNPSYISTMQYWVYDYKNVLGIVNRGMAPDMDQKGPYGYREVTEMKFDHFSDDKEMLTYSQYTKYIFDPSRSCAGCDPKIDKVKVPDISFLLALQQFQDFKHFCSFLNVCSMGALLEPIYDKDVVPYLGLAVSAFDTSPFVEVTVDELLFSSYKSPFIEKFMKHLMVLLEEIVLLLGDPFNLADMLKTINISSVPVSFVGSLESYGPKFTINTGKTDHDQVGNIMSFESDTGNSSGQTLPKDWWTTTCKEFSNALKLDGSTGDFFPSFLKKDTIVPIYVSDICRTINMEYERDISVNGIDCYRFVLQRSAFDYSIKENCGFCNQLEYGMYNKNAKAKCLPSGLLDIRRCQPHVSGQSPPVAVSKPHFYQADTVITSFNPRFIPGGDDETTMDVEPQTGTLLAANKRLQINILWNQFPQINSFKVMRPAAYPVYWINESFYADQGTINDLNSSLFKPVKTYKIVCWCAVGLGGLLILISFAMDVIIVFLRKKNV